MSLCHTGKKLQTSWVEPSFKMTDKTLLIKMKRNLSILRSSFGLQRVVAYRLMTRGGQNFFNYGKLGTSMYIEYFSLFPRKFCWPNTIINRQTCCLKRCRQLGLIINWSLSFFNQIPLVKFITIESLQRSYLHKCVRVSLAANPDAKGG